ncbi:hypothetical protein [Flagellimonas abyssi]|uniref:Uncharacterized protein n=1 Tax=Flagellimonas abyssi TaxID=2864871 RepID=A0ABS7EUE8_9FLAO|nr:hypothetical protein [Allomuricauda abyssi]MBW8201231.1 hypothetical protein [Allomuricauda abyssi]
MILRKMKILDFHKISYILVSIDTVIVGVAELEPLTITPYKPDVYVLYSKIGHPIGHLRVKLESFTAANIPNGFKLTQMKTKKFKFY